MSPSKLFKPLKLGRLELKSRVVLAPLTRFRADETHIPLPYVKDYYAQRGSVSGTLLISEATFIAPKAGGYPSAPGIWSEEQITSWKTVTEAVHAKGSFIFLQLWALGRAANPDHLKKEFGEDSKVKGPGDIAYDGGAKPTPLTEEEIKEYIGWYFQAAKNAIAAGFDGVEIHGATGYLVDQFLQDVSNNRTDSWGGSIENRARFGLEVAKAVVEAVGADRTGIRLNPYLAFQGMKMKDPIPQFTYFTQELKKLKLAYLHLVEGRIDPVEDAPREENLDFLIDAWDNQSPVLISGGFKPDTAKKAVDEEYKDKDILISFGRYFTSNPDLPFRIEKGIELTPYNRDTFYGGGEEGYITYPFSKEFELAQAK